jgi:hypothetical protein
MAGPDAARMAAAAAIIAREGARLAAPWSRQIPPSIRVTARAGRADITTGVGPAYPNETGARHPVYARGPRSRWTWVAGNNRPFLSPAAEAKADAAAAEIAKSIDDICHDLGYSGTG